ncbi:MAG TPA: hypothetical protein DCE42_06515, partial [Myxococcales bacterium]|nr:hypothetical protein [Myxococcales bacterium]
MKKYQIQRKLGAGGMGLTYLTTQCGVEGFEKPFVIKKLHPAFSQDEALISALISEAKIASLFEHPNIVSVYDLSKEDGEYYLVMEFVNGVTLAHLLNDGQLLPPTILLWTILQVLRGLDYVHEMTSPTGHPLHLVHRDISPDNILLSQQGVAKLTDFGLAKAREHSKQTAPGILKGKLGYMSPEQSAGLRVDRRSDVYSVGIILYEGLTGVRLFKNDNLMSTLKLVQNSTIPPIREFLPGIHPDLEHIIMKALTKDLDTRYQSAREFHDGLEAFLTKYSDEKMRRYTSTYIKAYTSPAERESISLRNFVQINQPPRPLVYILKQENDPIFPADIKRKLQDMTMYNGSLDFKVLTKRQEQDIALAQLSRGKKKPFAVLFGGLFVAMEHPFLKALQDYPEIMKILVMDHSSSEILEMSVELCGLTKFIRAPISVEELYITLIQTVDKQQSRERRESDFLREQILHTEKKEEAL